MAVEDVERLESGEGSGGPEFTEPVRRLPDPAGRLVKRLPNSARREWVMLVALVPAPVLLATGLARGRGLLRSLAGAAVPVALGYVARQGATSYYEEEDVEIAEILDRQGGRPG